jgi:hypothetical protein
VKTFRIYSHPNRPMPIVVKVGFSWPAFIFGPLWFLLNRMWLTAAIVIAFYVGERLFFRNFKPASPGGAYFRVLMDLLALVTWFLIARFANFLLCSDLEARGYVLRATVSAKDSRSARDEFEKKLPSGEAREA